MRLSAVILVVVVLTCTVSAQWSYRDPTAPRTADGKVDVKAPPPPTAAGTVDLSGIWQTDTKYNFNLGADLKPGDIVMLPWAQALVAERQGNLGKDDPEGFCLPPGFPRVNGVPFPQKIIQTTTANHHPLRDTHDVPADFPRHPSHARQRSAADLDGLFERTLGRRHAPRRDHGIQRQDVAGRMPVTRTRSR